MANRKRKLYINLDTSQLHIIEDDCVVMQTFETCSEKHELNKDNKTGDLILTIRNLRFDDAHITKRPLVSDLTEYVLGKRKK